MTLFFSEMGKSFKWMVLIYLQVQNLSMLGSNYTWNAFPIETLSNMGTSMEFNLLALSFEALLGTAGSRNCCMVSKSISCLAIFFLEIIVNPQAPIE